MRFLQVAALGALLCMLIIFIPTLGWTQQDYIYHMSQEAQIAVLEILSEPAGMTEEEKAEFRMTRNWVDFKKAESTLENTAEQLQQSVSEEESAHIPDLLDDLPAVIKGLGDLTDEKLKELIAANLLEPFKKLNTKTEVNELMGGDNDYQTISYETLEDTIYVVFADQEVSVDRILKYIPSDILNRVVYAEAKISEYSEGRIGDKHFPSHISQIGLETCYVHWGVTARPGSGWVNREKMFVISPSSGNSAKDTGLFVYQMESNPEGSGQIPVTGGMINTYGDSGFINSNDGGDLIKDSTIIWRSRSKKPSGEGKITYVPPGTYALSEALIPRSTLAINKAVTAAVDAGKIKALVDDIQDGNFWSAGIKSGVIG